MSDAQAGSEAGPPHCYRHPDRETWIRCQRCDRPICPDCMHSASVGFQCPSCVKEGVKSTRTPQGVYGGQRSGDPRLTTFILIGINVLVWIAIRINGGATSALADKLSIRPQGLDVLTRGGTEHLYGVSTGAWWQVVTSIFTHVEPLHIGLNMITLYFLGPPLEMILGRARFLALYFISGICGSAAVMLFSAPLTPTLGASGALYGLMGALVILAHKIGANPQQILVWIGLNLVITFTIPNISWQGHIGGLIGGAACAAVLAYAPKQNRAPVQTVGLAAIAGVAIVLTVVRATALG